MLVQATSSLNGVAWTLPRLGSDPNHCFRNWWGPPLPKKPRCNHHAKNRPVKQKTGEVIHYPVLGSAGIDFSSLAYLIVKTSHGSQWLDVSTGGSFLFCSIFRIVTTMNGMTVRRLFARSTNWSISRTVPAKFLFAGQLSKEVKNSVPFNSRADPET